MPGPISEVAGVTQSQIAGALGAGLAVLSENATLTFTLYQRFVLPIDGFVFWVKTSPVQQLTINPASLHHTTLNQQDEAESFSLQKFVLTCQESVDQLTAIAPNQLWIADWQGLKLAFSSRTHFYRAANTYHYAGDALYPSLATQILDYPSQVDSSQIVSNSLPIWLTLAQGFFPLYPSYVIPDNIVPPYGVIHIGEDDTTSMQLAPFYDPATSTRWQLVKDRVKVTLYGVRNDQMMDWMDSVQDYTLRNTSVMGLMNSPVPRDAKRGQTELGILAQKKVVTFVVNYYQTRVRAVAMQLIASVFFDFAVPGVDPFAIGPLPPAL